MGIMSPSKMPKAKTITRKDNPDKVEMYAKGGKVKKYAGGDSVKESFDRINEIVTRPRPKAEPKKEAPMKRLGPSDEDIVGNKPLVKGPDGKPYVPESRRKAKGGTSKVNAAGNYTKPGMRKSLFSSIKSGGKGGAPGQWSARKAQMLALQYKKKGGGYK
jgi:hypothetical protein